jgi:type I restriction enzyme R subunit
MKAERGEVPDVYQYKYFSNSLRVKVVYIIRKMIGKLEYENLIRDYYLTNADVIDELKKMAADIASAHKEGDELGLSSEELAFYHAITKPDTVKDFYTNDQLREMTHELTDMLRKSRTIDWQIKAAARAGMRMAVKRLLKKYKYPPEGMNDAIQTVISQCELWTGSDIE